MAAGKENGLWVNFLCFFLFIILMVLLGIFFGPSAVRGDERAARPLEKEMVSFAKDFSECLYLFINTDDSRKELGQRLEKNDCRIFIRAFSDKDTVSILVFVAGRNSIVYARPKEEILADKLAARKAAEEVFKYIKKHFLGTGI